MTIGIRWTIGTVSPRGFEALRLSIRGAVKVFGAEAAYTVVVNTLPVEDALEHTGPVPEAVTWRPAEAVPDILKPHLDAAMAEGTAWKFAPLRCFPDRWEIALDNDCILWSLPPSMAGWIGGDRLGCLMAEDVRLAHGRFTDLAGPRPGNTGIRGFPPGYDATGALARMLARHPARLTSELDEQGLQVAAFAQDRPLTFVATEEVALCSPFWPLQPHLGTCGAHFVGLNAHRLPWHWYDRPASEVLAEHWDRLRPELERLTS